MHLLTFRSQSSQWQEDEVQKLMFTMLPHPFSVQMRTCLQAWCPPSLTVAPILCSCSVLCPSPVLLSLTVSGLSNACSLTPCISPPHTLHTPVHTTCLPAHTCHQSHRHKGWTAGFWPLTTFSCTVCTLMPSCEFLSQELFKVISTPAILFHPISLTSVRQDVKWT